MIVIASIFMLIGVFFSAVGVIGIFRMKDVFGRLQASTCISTLGNICIVIAGIFFALAGGMTAGVFIKLILFMLFVLATNPVSNHALCKAAYKMGIRPESGFTVDDYAEDFKDNSGDEEREAKE